MNQRKITLKMDDLRVVIQAKRSEYPGYNRIEVTPSIVFESYLLGRSGWDNSAFENLTTHLFGALGGIDAVVERREFFTIDIPASAAQEPVIDVYKSIEMLLSRGPFSDAEVIELEYLSDRARGLAEGCLAKDKSHYRGILD